MKFDIGDKVIVINNVEDNCVRKGDEGIIIPHDKWNMNTDDWANEEDFINHYAHIEYTRCRGISKKEIWYTLTSRLKRVKITNWEKIL